MATVTELADYKITHEVMEPHLTGDNIYYNEESVSGCGYQCDGCGLIWAKKWYAETCEEREHRKSFDQHYYFKAPGYTVTGEIGCNTYTRHSLGRNKDWELKLSDAWAAGIEATVATAPVRPQTVVGQLHSAMEAAGVTKLWLPHTTITTAKANSTNPGALYLRDEAGTYVGKVTPEGEFKRAWEQNLSDESKAELREFVKSGAQYLATVGQDTGSCCYCGLELTDPESVQRGYGPVCAKKHGLPHGNRNGF